MTFPLCPFTVFGGFQVVVVPLSCRSIPVVGSNEFECRVPFASRDDLVTVDLGRFQRDLLIAIGYNNVVHGSVNVAVFANRRANATKAARKIYRGAVYRASPFVNCPIGVKYLRVALIVYASDLGEVIVARSVRGVRTFFLVPITLFLCLTKERQ